MIMSVIGMKARHGCVVTRVKSILRSQPSGPKHVAPETGAHPNPVHSKILRIASWNIKSCCRGLADVANGIEMLGVDLIALQEVERGTLSSGGIDQLKFLARSTGFEHSIFLPTLCRDGGEYGIALLSRHPLRYDTSIPLPFPKGDEPRLLGLAEIFPRMDAMPPLTVAFTHLSHRPDRMRMRLLQARAIVERLKGRDHCLLLGDFNGRAGTAMYQVLAKKFRDMFAEVGQGYGGTHAPLGRFFPSLRIDFLFASPSLKAIAARVIQTRASDHHALVGEIGFGCTQEG